MKTVLETFLNKQFTTHYDKLSDGLMYGKAGLALYYAIKGQRDKGDKKLYDKCVNDVLTNVSETTPLLLENGLLGICLSLNYILTKIEKGNSDYVLGDLDNIVYQKFSKSMAENNGAFTQYVEILFYLSIRLKYGLKAKERRALFEKEVIYIIEDVYSHLPANFFDEPMPYNFKQSSLLFVDALVRLYVQGIYKERICHILDELGYLMLGHTPALHANRLAMLCTVQNACNQVRDISVRWKECAEILKNHISVDIMLDDETKNRQIFFMDGLSGIYLLMIHCNKLLGEDKFPIDSNRYFYRVMTSNSLKDAKKETSIWTVGLNGFWGMSLLYDYMTNKENNLNK